MTATRMMPTPATAGVERTNGHRPTPSRSVNVGRVAVAVMLILGLSLAFMLLYMSAGDRRAVLAVARPVAAGAVITAADLTEARVSVDPALRPIPASRRSEAVGRPASVDLVPGTLLTRGHIAAGPVVASGRSVVGLALKAGQFPAGVRAGDRVLLVRPGAAPSAGTPSAQGAVLQVRGEVLAVDTANPPTGGTVVSVTVDAVDAPGLAVAASSGQVSLVVEGRGG